MPSRDTRSVGRPGLNSDFRQLRDVPVAQNKPRLNDQRKVRPHGVEAPPMGVRPKLPGKETNPKTPALGMARMQARDVPVKLMTEQELNEFQFPWNRSAQLHGGDAIGYQVSGDGGIRLYHVQNGQVQGAPIERDSYDTITRKVQQAWHDFEELRKTRAMMSSNPRKAARILAQQYAREQGMGNAPVGEIGRDIALDYSNLGGGGGAGRTAAEPAGDGRTEPPALNGGGTDMQSGSLMRGLPGGAARGLAMRNARNKAAGEEFWNGVDAPEPGMAPPGPAQAKPRIRVPANRPPMPNATPPAAEPALAPGEKMPMANVPMSQVDDLLNAAHAQRMDKGFWTPDRIRAGSELNKRQAAQKFLASRHTAANANRMAAESVNENRGEVGRTIAACKGMGMRCSYDHANNEFRVNHPHNREETAYYTDDASDAVGTARHMKSHTMHEGYPDPTIDDVGRDPAHQSKIGTDLRKMVYPHSPVEPDLNREFAQFRDLPVDKVTEMAEQDMEEMLEAACAMLGYAGPPPKKEKVKLRKPTKESTINRARGRFLAR